MAILRADAGSTLMCNCSSEQRRASFTRLSPVISIVMVVSASQSQGSHPASSSPQLAHE